MADATTVSTCQVVGPTRSADLKYAVVQQLDDCSDVLVLLQSFPHPNILTFSATEASLTLKSRLTDPKISPSLTLKPRLTDPETSSH